MYRYDQFDHDFVNGRISQFRDQIARRLNGDLTEDEFKPLRLQNGLYLQLHAYMLRVAIPYGTLSSDQLRKLAYIARHYDKGYGHFTTRQNIQYNWPKLVDVADILKDLADVEMHAIQTSGNCIRNVTADHFAGAAVEEIEDPRIYAELIRQWSTLHPEFAFLPRKFKIAVTGSDEDRAAIQVHDIGLALVRTDDGRVGFTVYVGGGLGRTPMVAKKVREFLPKEHLLSYLEAILRVYNLNGRRDNKYKARIKILVHETGTAELTKQINEEWEKIRDTVYTLPQSEIDKISDYFAPPAFETLSSNTAGLDVQTQSNPAFANWVERNVHDHKQDGYGIVTISLKGIGDVPGDATDSQMEAVADLADAFSFSELRVSHEQNLILPHVRISDLYTVWEKLQEIELATPNAGLITDIIACPGLDYCALANARSIPVAQDISRRFSDISKQKDIGDLKLKISGCINACGHHHVGHIGILGVDRKNEEFYQITLGGSADEKTSVGKIIGQGFSADKITDAIETVIDTYLEIRTNEQESFLDTYRRVGEAPFKENLYME